MPPKPKFSRAEVLKAALKIVRADGEASLTARRLGEELGASSRPIFTLFSSMEELKDALVPVCADFFTEYCKGFDDYEPAFKRIGLSTVSFAEEEPKLFAFMFMSSHAQQLNVDEWCRSETGDQGIEIIVRDYGLSKDVATILFREMWLHTFGLCVLKVTGAASITNQQVSDSLSRAFLGLLSLAKVGMLEQQGIRPVLGKMEGNASVSNPPTATLEGIR